MVSHHPDEILSTSSRVRSVAQRTGDPDPQVELCSVRASDPQLRSGRKLPALRPRLGGRTDPQNEPPSRQPPRNRVARSNPPDAPHGATRRHKAPHGATFSKRAGAEQTHWNPSSLEELGHRARPPARTLQWARVPARTRNAGAERTQFRDAGQTHGPRNRAQQKPTVSGGRIQNEPKLTVELSPRSPGSP